MLTYHILRLACWMNQLLNCQLTFCALNINFPPFVTFAIKEIFNSQSNFRNCVLFHPEPTNLFYLQCSVFKNIRWRHNSVSFVTNKRCDEAFATAFVLIVRFDLALLDFDTSKIFNVQLILQNKPDIFDNKKTN